MVNDIIDVTALHDVKMKKLKEIHDERGFVKHMIRSDSPFFSSFGEVYFSFTKYKVIKAWKYHKEIIQNMTVPMGNMRFVLYDPRESSPTFEKLSEFILGDDNFSLLQIPPGIIYGFQSLSENGTLIANCINSPHRPEESVTLSIDDDKVPYKWS